MFYLGLKEHLIAPFTNGYEGTAFESLYPSNTDMFRKAKAQSAVTGYVWSGDGDPIEAQLGVGQGFPVDLALGVVDAYEWSNASRGRLQVWHRALNNDLRVTPTGGEDSISNLHISKPVGSFRTYAHLGSEFTAVRWLTTLKKGGTFFTGGPLLEFEIDGKKPGVAIHLKSRGGRVEVNARVWSIVPLSRVVICRNGQPFRTPSINSGIRAAKPKHLGKPCAEFQRETAPATLSTPGVRAPNCST